MQPFILALGVVAFAGVTSTASSTGRQHLALVEVSRLFGRQVSVHSCGELTGVPDALSCERACGPGFAACVSFTTCYNPTAGEICCSDGTSCPAGSYCANNEKCCQNGLSLEECGATATLSVIPPPAPPASVASSSSEEPTATTTKTTAATPATTSRVITTTTITSTTTSTTVPTTTKQLPTPTTITTTTSSPPTTSSTASSTHSVSSSTASISTVHPGNATLSPPSSRATTTPPVQFISIGDKLNFHGLDKAVLAGFLGVVFMMF